MQPAPNLDYKTLYEGSQLQIIQLRHELDQMKKMIYGSRNERFVAFIQNTSQLSLDIKADEVEVCNITAANKILYQTWQRSSGPSRANEVAGESAARGSCY